MNRKLKIVAIGLVAVLAAGIGAYFLLYRDIPYYKTMRNLRVTRFTKDKILVGADIICHNPNNIAIRLADCNFDVYANGKLVANVKQNYGSQIGAAMDFKVPVNVSFSPLKVFKPKDLIGGAFLSMLDKKIDLRYDGYITVGVAGQDVEIDVDVEDWVALKPEK